MNFHSYFSSPCWWGKLIGAAFGYLISGPAGSIFGLLIGNFFDRGMVQYIANPYWHFHTEKKRPVQTIFFETTFFTLGYLAKSDGHVSEEEIELATKLMKSLRLTKEQKDRARVLFNQGKQPNVNIHATLTNFYRVTQYKPDLLNLFIQIQYRVVQLNPTSHQTITAMNHILSNLGYAPLTQQQHHYDKQQQTDANWNANHRYTDYSYSNSPRHATGLHDAFERLNIPSNSTQQEVKRAYRRLISRYHPDKLIAKGESDMAIKLATIKTQEIREAYERICGVKGW